jgi:thiosulfate reductase/polysulfide reductase chain A
MAKYGHRAVVPPNRHVAWYGNDTQRLRALFILNTLLGNYGREGGFYFPAKPWVGEYEYPPSKVAGGGGGCGGGSGKLGSDTLPEGIRSRVDGRNEKFLFGGLVEPELFKAIASGKPYPVKGLVAAGTNLFHSMPDVPGVKKALKNLDFYLCVDILPQEHVLWADVILPDTTYLERYGDLHSVPHKTTPFVSFSEPAVEPLYDTKPGWWIARELGIRLGLEEYFPWKNYEEYLTTRLDSLGITLEQIKKDGVIKQPQLSKPYIKDYESQGETLPFNTDSEKIEIYSKMLEDAGQDPLPKYEKVQEPPKGYFRLLYGRSPVHSFSRTQSNRWLSKIEPENKVWVNTRVAAKLGIRNGEYVILENKEGTKSNRIKVKVTERIRSDCVYMVHGFGHNTPGLKRQHKKGASDIALQSHYNLDPISGSCGLHVNFVKINKNGGIV